LHLQGIGFANESRNDKDGITIILACCYFASSIKTKKNRFDRLGQSAR
jgi:hypothetical protein